MREAEVMYWTNRLRDGTGVVQESMEFKPMTSMVKLVSDIHSELVKADRLLEALDGHTGPVLSEVVTYITDLDRLKFLATEEIGRRGARYARP